MKPETGQGTPVSCRKELRDLESLTSLTSEHGITRIATDNLNLAAHFLGRTRAKPHQRWVSSPCGSW